MKLTKSILLVLIIGTIVPFLSFLYAQTSAIASAAPELSTLATTLVNFLVEGKFEEAVKLFNAKMVEALPPQKLEATWNGLISRVGEFRDIDESRFTEEKGYRVVYVTCDFAKASLDVKVVFDDEGKIAGLWFVPTKTQGLPGIYIAALIATVISVLFLGGLVYWRARST